MRMITGKIAESASQNAYSLSVMPRNSWSGCTPGPSCHSLIKSSMSSGVVFCDKHCSIKLDIYFPPRDRAFDELSRNSINGTKVAALFAEYFDFSVHPIPRVYFILVFGSPSLFAVTRADIDALIQQGWCRDAFACQCSPLRRRPSGETAANLTLPIYPLLISLTASSSAPAAPAAPSPSPRRSAAAGSSTWPK